MLEYSDWIVGGVSILLGLALCVGAATAARQLFDLPKVRWLDQRVGRQATQAILVALGIALVVLGIAIARGWKVHWERHVTVRSAISGRY